MTCLLCGGKLQKKKVKQEIRFGNNYVMAPVNALVYSNCHETYYLSGVVDDLIEFKKSLKKNHRSLKPIGKVYSLSIK